MLKQATMILSPYTKLYDIIIPKDNMLRKINGLGDFYFIYEELINIYCTNNVGGAIDPIKIFKYLLLKTILDVSDVEVVERSKYDMSFKYFLSMTPKETLINPSSLTKFRKLCLRNLINMYKSTNYFFWKSFGELLDMHNNLKNDNNIRLIN